MDKFDEYKVSTSDSNKALVNEYLNKVRDFINNNSLDSDLYFDIEERVFEKISSHKQLDQLKIKQALNDIWDPEDIFELEESKANSDFFIFARNMKNAWVKSMKKIFESWFNFKNFFILIKTIIKNLFKFVKKVLIKVYAIVLDIVKNFSKYFLIVSSFIIKISKKIFTLFWSIIWFIILWFAIIMLFMVPVLYSWLEISNINYTNIIPFELIISYWFIVLSISILWSFFILKKQFLTHFILFWVSSILIFSFWFLWWTKLYNNHSFEWKLVEKITLESDKNVLNFYWYDLDLYWNMYLEWEVFNDYWLKIKKSESSDIEVKIVTEVFTKNKETLETISWSLSHFDLTEVDWSIILWLKDWLAFKEKSDFIPMFRNIELYIPENKIINLWNHRHNYYSDFIWNCNSRQFWVINWEVVCVEKKIKIKK